MATGPLAFVSPAKINLFLAVTGKRTDGYHDLVSLMWPITLADTVVIEPTRLEITVSCGHPDVPEDETNLAHRAVRLFLAHWIKERKGRPFGVHITIEKRIPVAAGLGGGSSNAATVLLALNRMCRKPYTKRELSTMALELGADVPFFIYQRPALASGIGEILQPVDGNLQGFSIILVHPVIRIDTATVFKNLNLGLTKCQQQLKNSNLRAGKISEDIFLGAVEKYLCNDLETVTAIRYPVIETIKQTLLSLGATGALMTGSGPTVFGLFRDKTAARKAFGILDDPYPGNVFQVGCRADPGSDDF